jgi:CubicO group peptidase (beta-lactamase class C family)
MKAIAFLLSAPFMIQAADAPAHPDKAGMNAARLARIPTRMQSFVDEGKTAGVVTLLARHGQLALLSAVGYQDRENKIPMRTDTIFQIKSMTKPVTSVGLMILVDEGKLAIIDPVEKYLPEFKGQKFADGHEPSRPINIRDLLTHTSGMSTAMPERRSAMTLAEVVSLEARQPLQFEPGTKWQYNNAGIAAVGRIIEVVSGKPYERFIDERILQPLGMKDTFYFPPESKRARIAAVYTDDKGTLRRAADKLYREGETYPQPEGGLYSTAVDMSHFYQMMLNGGEFAGHRILSPAAVRLMTRVHTGDLKAGFAPGLGWGLGWSVVRNVEGTFRMNSIGTFGHGGAYRTYGWVDPGQDMLGVILMQRTNNGGDISDEMNAFMQLAAAAIESPVKLVPGVGIEPTLPLPGKGF